MYGRSLILLRTRTVSTPFPFLITCAAHVQRLALLAAFDVDTGRLWGPAGDPSTAAAAAALRAGSGADSDADGGSGSGGDVGAAMDASLRDNLDLVAVPLQVCVCVYVCVCVCVKKRNESPPCVCVSYTWKVAVTLRCSPCCCGRRCCSPGQPGNANRLSRFLPCCCPSAACRCRAGPGSETRPWRERRSRTC